MWWMSRDEIIITIQQVKQSRYVHSSKIIMSKPYPPYNIFTDGVWSSVGPSTHLLCHRDQRLLDNYAQQKKWIILDCSYRSLLGVDYIDVTVCRTKVATTIPMEVKRYLIAKHILESVTLNKITT